MLDTDTVTLVQHNFVPVLEAIRKNRSEGHEIGITAVTIEEQMEGWLKAIKMARTDDRAERTSIALLRSVRIWASFALYPTTAGAFAEYRRLRQAKLNVGGRDLRIAAIALELDATVVTRNLRDFRRVPNLKFVDWSATNLPTSSVHRSGLFHRLRIG